MSQTPACPDVPASIAGDPLLTMLWHAVRFSNWAAGEGQCPNEDQGVRAPDEFLFDYSNATDEEDWETLADRLPQILADRASRALPSTALAARPQERWTEALRPFAEYMTEGMDCDYDGNLLPDSDGVGWVYLTQGDFRRAKRAFASADFLPCTECGNRIHPDDETIIGEAPMHKTPCAVAWLERNADDIAGLVAPSTPPTAGDGHD